MKKQRRAKAEDIGTIFRYRGCGFSMEEISEITDLSPQTVSYQLSKLKKTVDETSISDTVETKLGYVPRSRLHELQVKLDDTVQTHSYELGEALERIDELEYQIGYGGQPTNGDPEYEYDYDDPIDYFLYNTLPEAFIEDGGAVLDASEVLFHMKKDVDPMAETAKENFEGTAHDVTVVPQVVPNQRGLSSMINSLEHQGWPVVAILGYYEYEYAISGKMPLITEQEIHSLKNLRSSRKLLLFSDEMQLNHLLQVIIAENHKIRIITNESTLVEKNPDAVVTYQWHGPVCVFNSLPQGGLDSLQKSPTLDLQDQVLGLSVNSLDDDNMVKGSVMTLLSHGEYVPIPDIHGHLASVFLSIDPISEKGWPQRLKERLNLNGKNFSTQLSNLMGDMIEFSSTHPPRVRKSLGGMKDE